MNNEEVKVDDIEEGADEVTPIQEVDSTDWKAEALKAQEFARQQAGIAKRNATRLKKLREAKPPAEKPKADNQKTGFDYAEKAYLKTSGVESQDFSYLFEAMQATGKDLDGVLESQHIQAELKERKEGRATSDAIPTGTKRSGNAARDSVEYWLAKGELPPRDQRELRSQVLAAKIKAAKAESTFTDNPIV